MAEGTKPTWRQIVGSITRHRWVRILLWMWALIGGWNTLRGELLPVNIASRLPNTFGLVTMLNGHLPFGAWLLGFAAILVVAAVEYARRGAPPSFNGHADRARQDAAEFSRAAIVNTGRNNSFINVSFDGFERAIEDRGEGNLYHAIDIRREPTPLAIVVGDGPTFRCATGKGRSSIYTIDRRLGARIENRDSLRAVRNGKLSLISLEPDEGCTLPRVLAERLAINAGDHALIPLVRYQERRPDLHPSSPAGDTMMLIGYSGDDPVEGCPAGLDNTLTLRATAEDMPPCETKVRVWVEDNKLRIAQV